MEQRQLLVLTGKNETDPELGMLHELPHVLGSQPDAFTKAAKEATAILNWSASRELLRPVFLMAPNLRWVHSRSAGLDKLLFPELAQSDVVLTNGSGVFSPSLGEFALTAMLYFAKDLPRMLRNQAAGVWEQFTVEEIAGRTVGIVGYGDIGKQVARRAHAMGMHVLATKRRIPDTPDPWVDRFFATGDQKEMFKQSDYIVVAAPLTKDTHHLVGKAEFAAMKPNAVIINVGRGPVIDEDAMAAALSEKRIKGAGLDVFEHEPLPASSPFYRLQNVLLSAHTADHTDTWLQEAMQFFLQQYARFEKGEPLENVVDKHSGY
jgi:phosphoglycerate dehydrogenase-like enzyme